MKDQNTLADIPPEIQKLSPRAQEIYKRALAGNLPTKSSCKLCGSKYISIDVETKDPDNKFWFSSRLAVGLKYCPLCGRYIGDYIEEASDED